MLLPVRFNAASPGAGFQSFGKPLGPLMGPPAARSATCKDETCPGYWIDHLYTRAVMALPTGAVLYFLSRR
jgi:hypothetical protein